MIDRILRKLPAFKGKQRLARLLLKNEINQLKEIIIQGKYDCGFKIPNLKEHVGFELFVNGVYERNSIAFLINRIDKDSVFLDLGANIGSIAIPIGKERGDVQFVCVEAAPWLFEFLKFNVSLNKLQNFELLNFAVAEEEDKEVPFYSPHDAFGKGSMAPIFTSEGVLIKTKTIDSISGNLPKQVGMIKIDIEGFEYYAFLGGKALLSQQDAPDILFEFVDWAENSCPGIKAGAAQRLLFSYGYHLHIFEDGVVKKRIFEPLLEGAYMFFATKRDV